MSKEHLKLEPHNIHPGAWWYETNGGIEVCIEPRPATQIVYIPWVSLRAALKRKDRPKEKSSDLD